MPLRRDWSNVQGEIKKKSKGYQKDERIYKPKWKDDQTFKVILRLLPGPSADQYLPYAKLFTHYFEGPGGWYIKTCPTTIEKPCPTCEDNRKHWKKGKQGELFVKNRKSGRKLKFYINVLIIDDSQDPSKNGKVMLLEYGDQVNQKILENIKENTNEKTKESIVPWDVDKGFNFIYKGRKKMVKDLNRLMPNYEGSNFSETSTPLSQYAKEDVIESSIHEIGKFESPENFEPYDKLMSKFMQVLGNKIPTQQSSQQQLPPVIENVPVSDEKVFVDSTDEAFFDTITSDATKDTPKEDDLPF